MSKKSEVNGLRKAAHAKHEGRAGDVTPPSIIPAAAAYLQYQEAQRTKTR